MKYMSHIPEFSFGFLFNLLILPLASPDQNLINLSSNLMEFCHNNGLKHLTFITNEDSNSNVKKFLQISTTTSKRFKSSYTRLSNVNVMHYAEKLNYDLDNLVVISTVEAVNMDVDLEIMTKGKIMKSMIVIVDPINETFISRMKNTIRNMSKNMFFYLVFSDEFNVESMVVQRVISIQNNDKILFQHVQFDNNGKIVANYNLEGMHIPCITLSWAPYAELIDCDPKNQRNCITEGYLSELLNIVARQLNFTWHCDAEPNGNWGVIPISGPANASGIYGGVVGLIANGSYPLGVSFWINIESRVGLLDFVVSGKGDQYLMALVPKSPEYDSTLFTRPFTTDAWWMIGITNILLIFSLIITWFVPRWKSELKTKNNSFRLVKSIIWLTYLLITIYYGGALKMFFTTEITIPFQSQKEVMLAYPEWKMRFRKGNEVLFYKKSEVMDDAIYDDYWERATNSPEEVKYNSIEEGINYLFEDQVVIHVSNGLLKQYYKNNPKTVQPKTFSSEGEKFGENMIVTKNSPLGPILGKGFQILCENGIVDLIDIKWRGKDISSDADGYAYASPLNEGQLMMPFALLCAVICVSAAVLVSEYLFNYFDKKKSVRQVFVIKR